MHFLHVYLTCSTAPGDYTSVSLDFDFEADRTGVFDCIPIPITDDGISEPCERFFVTISTGISRVKTVNNTPVIVIDDDRK